MIEAQRKDAELRMGKSLDALKSELSKVRTGRAHPSILDHVKVDYYGQEVPLSQVAKVVAEDARNLSVTPWEKEMVSKIEKAIMTSDLGLNPMSMGMVIRVPLPALTEDRRRDLVKVVRTEAEASKVAIRNIRRDVNGALKNQLKDKLISEDEERRAQDVIQKLTDKFVVEVEATLAVKEKELMEV